MRPPFSGVLLIAALLFFVPLVVKAQSTAIPKKTDYSVIFLKTGESRIGRLYSLNSEEVQFAILNSGIVTYRSRGIEKIETWEKRYVYSEARGGFIEEPLTPRADGAPSNKLLPAARSGNERSHAASSADKTQTVIAEGLGETVDLALKDAFRAAVRKAVGVAIDSETRVNQDELQEKILTYSDGFVQTFKEIDRQKEAGLFRIKIQAEIKRRSLVEKLQAANVAVGKLDGGSLFAEIVTQMEAEKDAQKLLEHTLKGYPFGCIKAELRGKPEVLSRDEESARIRLTYEIRADEKAYALFAERLRNTLAGVARANGDFTMTVRTITANRYAMSDPAGARKNPLQNFAGKSVTMVALAKHSPQPGERFSWEYFVLDGPIRKNLRELAQRAGQVQVKLLDDEGISVAQDAFTLETGDFIETNVARVPAGSRSHVNVVYPLWLLNSDFRKSFEEQVGQSGNAKNAPPLADYFLLSPVFFQGGPGQFMTRLSVTREMQLSLSQLRLIKTAECEVDFKKDSPKQIPGP